MQAHLVREQLARTASFDWRINRNEEQVMVRLLDNSSQRQHLAAVTRHAADFAIPRVRVFDLRQFLAVCTRCTIAAWDFYVSSNFHPATQFFLEICAYNIFCVKVSMRYSVMARRDSIVNYQQTWCTMFECDRATLPFVDF